MKILSAARFTLVALLSLLLMQSCQLIGNSPKKTAKQIYFFDLAGFFNKEAARLTKSKIKTEKRLTFNDKKDQLPNAKLDFEKELAVFINSDINKLSWRDKYQADSLYDDQKVLTKIQYKALEKQLKTQQVSIEFAGSKVSKIRIHNRLKSIIAQSEEELLYEPAVGYAINGTEVMRLAGKNTMGVAVKFK